MRTEATWDDARRSASRSGREGGARRSSTAARPLVGLFILWLAVLTVFLLAQVEARGIRSYVLGLDFRPYYTGGLMLLGGVKADFYALPTQYLWQRAFAPEVSDPSWLLPFLNPPFVAAPLALVAALPLETAYVAWLGLNVALLAAVCRRLVRTLEGTRLRVTVYTLALSLTFAPVWVAAMQGQVSFVLVLALLGGWAALRSGRDLHGGLWLALLLVKPQLLLAPALALAWRRRLQALAGLALGGAALFGASLALVGWEGLEGYARLTVGASSWGEAYGVHPQRMHTWRGFLHLLLGTNDPSEVQPWWLLGVVLALGLLLWTWRGRWNPQSQHFALQWATLVVVMLLISPHVNFHDLSLLMVPGVLLARYLASLEQAGRLDKVLTRLPLVGYLATWMALFASSDLRLQPSVLFMLLALLMLACAAGLSRRRATSAA